jgi:Sap, sulfolipid-1-addressing protein
VYALLARGRSPSRLLTAYVVAGLAFTIAVGVIVIAAFGGAHIEAGSRQTKGIAQIIAGVLAIAFGFAALTGHVGGRADAPRAPDRFDRILGREISTATAAIAGPVTHIPGVFYILALDLIVSSQRDLTLGLVDLLLYNAVWFAPPIAALALSVVNPRAARRIIAAIRGWTGAHSRQIVLTVAFGGGAALVVAGWLTV